VRASHCPHSVSFQPTSRPAALCFVAAVAFACGQHTATIDVAERDWSSRGSALPPCHLAATPICVFHIRARSPARKPIAQEAPETQDPRGSHSSCHKIIERYSPLANRHPGEAPLDVLANTPGSGLKMTEQTVGDTVAVADFPAWAAAQRPPFAISQVLLKALKEYEDTGDPGALARVPDTDFYSFTRADGSEHCSDSQSFRVLGGFAFPWATPAEPGGEGSCDVGAEYAALDGTPLAIMQDYNWRPEMTASLDVWRWSGRDFSHECHVSLSYKPRFKKETLNDWGETCKGNACEALRRAAFKLAAATEADPTALKDGSLDPLTPAQGEEFKAMAETFQSQPRDPLSNDAFSMPFF
jgi:hypothetical protein